MKDLELAESFRDYFASLVDENNHPLFAGWLLHTGQSEEDFVFEDPANAVLVTFESKSEPLAASGQFSRSSFTITVESHSQDGSAALHGQRVSRVRNVLFGASATERPTKAAVIAAINAAGAVRVLGYSAAQNETGTDSNRFKTTIPLVVGYADF